MEEEDKPVYDEDDVFDFYLKYHTHPNFRQLFKKKLEESPEFEKNLKTRVSIAGTLLNFGMIKKDLKN